MQEHFYIILCGTYNFLQKIINITYWTMTHSNTHTHTQMSFYSIHAKHFVLKQDPFNAIMRVVFKLNHVPCHHKSTFCFVTHIEDISITHLCVNSIFIQGLWYTWKSCSVPLFWLTDNLNIRKNKLKVTPLVCHVSLGLFCSNQLSDNPQFWNLK